MSQSSAPVPYPGPLDSTQSTQRDGIIIPAAEYSHSTNLYGLGNGKIASPEYFNGKWKGVRLYINLTNRHTTGTLVVKVQVKDNTSGNWADLPGATTATLTAVATTLLTVYPALAETPNVDISDPLGVAWRVVATVATNHVDFSVGGDYLN